MTWISAQAAAHLLGVTVDAIYKAIKQNKYTHRYVKGIGRGGRMLQIDLDSLPETAQARYYGEESKRQQSAYMSLTADQRAIVDFKCAVVLKYGEFKKVYSKSDKMCAFLAQYNQEHPAEPLTRRQVNHWEKLFDRDGLDGLVDRRGGYNKGSSTVPNDMWQVFLKLWSKQSKPSAQSCYNMLPSVFPDRKIPGYSSFIRKLEKVDKPYKTLYRKGKKAFEDECLNYMLIDYSTMYSNQQWVADHHVFDVLVVDENGRVFRAWLCAWMDRKSRMIVGFTVSSRNPNSDLILDSFARACHSCGIPDEVLTDNGKDFKVYDLFNSDFALSVSREMGIKVTRANPYNAKAKPIERFFGTLEGYCKHLSAYIGNDPKKRPEHMDDINANLREKAMPINDFIKFVSDVMKIYNNSPHNGEGMDGKSPVEVYSSTFTKPVRIVQDKDILNLFLMRTSKPVTVGRNGILIKFGQSKFYYDDEKLFPLQGQKVYARYNIDDVTKVLVFTEKLEFVCIAHSRMLSQIDGPVNTDAIRENNKIKSNRRKLTREQYPKVSIPTIEETAASMASDGKVISFHDVKVSVPMVNSTKSKQAKAIKVEEQRQANKALGTAAVSPIGLTREEIDEKLNQLYMQYAEGG